MSDAQLHTLFVQLVAALFGLLTLILGWMGNKLSTKLDSMTGIFDEIKREIQKIDNRVTRLEERCRREHDGKAL